MVTKKTFSKFWVLTWKLLLIISIQLSYQQQTSLNYEVLLQFSPYARILRSNDQISGQFILDSLVNVFPEFEGEFGDNLLLQRLDRGYQQYVDISNMQEIIGNGSVVQILTLESESQSGSLEGRLRVSLLTGYDRGTYPWAENGNEPVSVTVHLNVHKVLDLDLAFGELTLQVWYTLRWQDPRLEWSPEEWNGTQKIFFQDDEIYSNDDLWNPNIELWNAHAPLEDDMYPQPFEVTNDGLVTWVRFGDISISCDMKGLHNFPYDRTECNLEFGSWVYDGSLVHLNTSSSGFTIGGSLTSARGSNKFAQYDLQEHLLEVREFIYNTDHDLTPLDDRGWPVLIYHIVLTRQPTQYTAKIFVPQLVLTLVAFGAFWLSPECGERIGLVITIPLANAVYDLIVFQELPDSRDMVFASAFGLGNFVFNMFVVVESVIVLLLWGKRDPYMAAPWRSAQKLLQDFRDQRDWVIVITAVEEYLFKLARYTSAGGAKKLIKDQHQIGHEGRIPRGSKFEYFMDNLRGAGNQNSVQVTPTTHVSKDSIAEVLESSKTSNSQGIDTHVPQGIDTHVPIIHEAGKFINSLADFQTREDVRKFIRSVKMYQVDVKGRKYVQEAFERLSGRHGEVAVEQRIVSLLAVKDEDDDFMGANLKNVRADASEEYMLKWQMMSKMLDRACQIIILPAYCVYLAVFIGNVVKTSDEHINWFEDLTGDYQRQTALTLSGNLN